MGDRRSYLVISAAGFDGASLASLTAWKPTVAGSSQISAFQVLTATGNVGRFTAAVLGVPNNQHALVRVVYFGGLLPGDSVFSRSSLDPANGTPTNSPRVSPRPLSSDPDEVLPLELFPRDDLLVLAPGRAGSILIAVENLSDSDYHAWVLAMKLGACCPGGLQLGNDVPIALVIGAAGGAGVSPLAARQDHEHPFPAPASPLTVRGVSNLAGVGTRTAREDHLHRLELEVQLAGVLTAARPRVDFEGAVLVVDDVPGDRAVVTVTAAAVGGALPSQIDVGDAGGAGVSPLAARQDHEHPFPAPASPVAVRGVSNLAGVGTRAAREDHLHRLELEVQLAGVLQAARPRVDFEGAVLVVDDVPGDRAVVTITAAAVGGALPSQIDVGDAGGAGVSPLAARQDHEHPFPAPASPLTVRGVSNLAGVGTRAAREDHLHRLELEVQLAGVLQAARPRVDFEGAVLVVDDVPGDRAVVTVTAAAVGGALPSQIDVGDAGGAGVSPLAARQDHEHPFPAPAAPLTVRGVSNLAGVGTRAAREDHLHRLELEVQLAGVLQAARPRVDFEGAVLVVDDVPGDRAVVTVTAAAVGGALPSQIDIGDAGGAGVSPLAARQDHEHPFPAPAAPLTVRGVTNLAGTGTRVAREDHVHRLELEVLLAGALIGGRPRLNFVSGATAVDNAGGDRVDVSIVPVSAVPLNVTASATVVLGAASVVLMSGNIVLPTGGGTIQIIFSGGFQLGAFLIGSNGALVSLRVGGVAVPNSARSVQITATLIVALSLDSQEMSAPGQVAGLPAGAVLVEVLAQKLGGVSTASAVGPRSLHAFMLL